jgi:predicted amidohydrolase
MRVAAVQMTAGDDRAANLERTAPLVAAAADAGAELVVLPELFSLLGRGPAMRAGAEPPAGATTTWAAAQARAHGVWLLAGSFPEQRGERFANTSCLFDPNGVEQARYRKIHLFDNEVPGAAYRESDAVEPGTEVVVAPVGDVVVGLSTCYDLRFPELYRALADRGAQVVVVPAAFTAVTGEAHWEPLLRARAIEDQCFVVAAGQWGMTGTGIRCHGHSMVVDPWGVVLAQQADGDGVVVADLDLDRLAEVRASLPALTHRRPDLFGPA